MGSGALAAALPTAPIAALPILSSTACTASAPRPQTRARSLCAAGTVAMLKPVVLGTAMAATSSASAAASRIPSQVAVPAR